MVLTNWQKSSFLLDLKDDNLILSLLNYKLMFLKFMILLHVKLCSFYEFEIY